MGDLSVLKRCVTELNRVVDNIGADQLGDPTPCSEWVVRDVLNHVAAGGTMFATGAEQGSISDELVSKLFVTEDPRFFGAFGPSSSTSRLPAWTGVSGTFLPT